VESVKIERGPKVELYTIPRKRPRYFTHEEEEKLMEQLTGTLSHLLPYVIVGIGTGLRPPSEIFGLKKSDVDFERDVLRAGTKTNEEREIPISPEVKEVLLELHRQNPLSEYFFVNQFGKQRKVVKNGFRKALDNAGIKNASSYTMRHTFGTRLGAAGYNSYEIMALMGHKNIQTSAIYVGAVDERTRAAVQSVFRSRTSLKSPPNEKQPLEKVAVNR
jgi:integrase